MPKAWGEGNHRWTIRQDLNPVKSSIMMNTCFGSSTGMKSGKVLAYGTRNKLCDYEIGRNVEKLSPYGSRQSNESSNAVVASKAPKSRYYGTTESYDFRVAADVGQKNIGTSYISSVYKQLQLSPGSTGEILVVHNDFSFDFPISGIRDVDFGFVDFVRIFKQVLPDRKKQKLNFNLNFLAKDLLSNFEFSNAHNELVDVQAFYSFSLVTLSNVRKYAARWCPEAAIVCSVALTRRPQIRDLGTAHPKKQRWRRVGINSVRNAVSARAPLSPLLPARPPLSRTALSDPTATATATAAASVASVS
ncbi:Dna polymerase iii polc-type [Gryllus bimaculatus]|nr:Dna polymerase iii polc-type [Gryllus bimaculatus]